MNDKEIYFPGDLLSIINGRVHTSSYIRLTTPSSTWQWLWEEHVKNVIENYHGLAIIIACPNDKYFGKHVKRTPENISYVNFVLTPELLGWILQSSIDYKLI